MDDVRTPAGSWPEIDWVAADAAVRVAPRGGWYSAAKPAVDFLVAVPLAVLLAPVMLVAWAAVRLGSRGPGIYVQTRSGLGKRPYPIYKLRTMGFNCEAVGGIQWSQKGDVRVTPVGKLLRVTHLDELPQLLNVLRGEMSLVGPRPERPEVIDGKGLTAQVPGYEHRLSVRPGVTGLAQIQLPADSDLNSVRHKVAYDLYYIMNQTLWLDARIVLATAFKAAGVGPASLRRLFRLPTREQVAAGFVATVVQPTPRLVDHLPAGRMSDPLPRVLYVTHRVPFPPDKGDRIRNYHVLRQLAKRARVWLLALADEPVPDATRAELAKLCERVEYFPVGGFGQKLFAVHQAVRHRWSLSAGMQLSHPALERVAEWAAEARFAAEVVSAGSLGRYLGKTGRRVVDLVDVDSQKWLDFADATGGPKRRLYRFEAGRTRAEERSLAEWVSAVMLVSRHEADVFDSFTRPGAATVATNGVDLDYWHPTDTPEQVACAFVGALDYLPNVDAACWFADAVWPRIREKFPTAEFRVIGRRPAAKVQALGKLPGVTVVGQVPDVRPHVASAAVCVVPMRLSRGLQNKVLEALAMGKATVAAPPALAALRAEPGVHLLRAESPDEWVDAVCGLQVDPVRRRELGTAGRRFVEANHHWDTCLKPLVDAVIPATAEVRA